MNWKVPIDTQHDKVFGENLLVRDLYRKLLLSARNQDMKETAFYKGKPFKLKRGQAIYGRLEYSKDLRSNPSSVDRALLTLQKWYSRITSERSKNYTIVTIINYDDEIKMDKQLEEKRTRGETKVDTNKSDKNDKNENNILTPIKEPRPPNEKDKLITLAAELQGIQKFTNYAKQLKAISLIEKAGHSKQDIAFVIQEMSREEYWKLNTFDLMNVYNNFDRYMNKTVIYKKGAGNGKYNRA